MANTLLSLSSNVLLHVVDDEIPFPIAIKNFLNNKKLAGSEKVSISSLVGCSLRHFYVFERKVKELFPEISSKVKYDIFVYLANTLFIHAVNEEQATKFIKTTFENEADEAYLFTFKEFLNNSSSKEFLNIEGLDETSNEYLSIRYNTPLWLVKMWGKHFKENLLFKTLRANIKPQKQFYLVNTYRTDVNELVASYKDFKDVGFKDIVSYEGKIKFKDSEAASEDLLYPFNAALSYALDTCDLDPFRNVAIFTGYRTNVYLKLVAKFSNKAKLDFITDDSSCYFDAKNKAKELGLERMRIYEQKASSIISCVSTKVNTFIVMPRNSNFASFKTQPDYFLRFKQNDLDSLIEGEKEALHEASLLIEDGGELLYAVPTLNIKEGRGLIKKFLSSHPDFVLGEEKQFFPFTEYDTTLYFARLRKLESAKND